MNWKDQLRKGNIIQTEYGISEICAIAFGDFYVKGAGGRMLHAKEVEPALLNEQFLIDSGFTKGKCLFDEMYEFTIIIDNQRSFSVGLDPNDGNHRFEAYNGCYSQKLKHIHQLQNLYWELTGKQLEYKPVNQKEYVQ